MLYQLSYFRNFRFSAEHRFRPFGGGEATARKDVVATEPMEGFEPPTS